MSAYSNSTKLNTHVPTPMKSNIMKENIATIFDVQILTINVNYLLLVFYLIF